MVRKFIRVGHKKYKIRTTATCGLSWEKLYTLYNVNHQKICKVTINNKTTFKNKIK